MLVDQKYLIVNTTVIKFKRHSEQKYWQTKQNKCYQIDRNTGKILSNRIEILADKTFDSNQDCLFRQIAMNANNRVLEWKTKEIGILIFFQEVH